MMTFSGHPIGYGDYLWTDLVLSEHIFLFGIDRFLCSKLEECENFELVSKQINLTDNT